MPMKRREFLTGAAWAGVASFALPLIGSCNSPGGREVSTALSSDEFEISEFTISMLQDVMQTGKYTSKKLVAMYLDRISRIDKNGFRLNSVIEINPDALSIAEEMDRERESGKVRSKLHGIPVLIKDNIDTADKMLTTAGSLALASVPAQKDAFIVKQLRDSGAVLLGKTNLSEWANFRSTRSTSGWSGRGGQTRNPYVLDRNPCGSSSGSGVAVAANLCAVAIGTETDGSVVCPSSTNGITGIKPTLGLWSRSGIIPIAHSQDTAGPMTRTVEDAAILLGLLADFDPDDPASADGREKWQTDYTRYLDPLGLQGARIGMARNFFGFNAEVDILMEKAVEAMQKQGAEVIDPANIETAATLEKYEMDVLLYEFKNDLNRYLSGLSSSVKYRTLKDLITFNESNREKEMPWFGQEIFLNAEKKGSLTDKAYLEAVENLKRLSGKDGIDATLIKYNLDAIVAPTGGPAWTTDWVNGDHYSGGSSSPAACAGYPAITVPAGFVHGLPIGITFMGTAWSEPVLIRLAYAFEQATMHRKAPGFIKSLEG
jgi:amidase